MKDESQARTEGSSILANQAPKDLLERLKDSKYEAAVARITPIPAHAARLRRHKQLTSPNRINNQDFNYTLEDAADDGIITMQEAAEITETDVITLAKDHNTRDPAYLVTEAAENSSQTDVLHAARRARLLQKATGTPAHAAVMGGRIGGDVHRLADQEDVVTVRITL